jgi:hypothetical protein
VSGHFFPFSCSFTRCGKETLVRQQKTKKKEQKIKRASLLVWKGVIGHEGPRKKKERKQKRDASARTSDTDKKTPLE